jgi:hypothetical protein
VWIRCVKSHALSGSTYLRGPEASSSPLSELRRTRFPLLAFLVLHLMLPQQGSAASLEKTAAQNAAYGARPPEWISLDGNSINCTIASDGPYVDYRLTSSAGMEWPNGSGKTPVFAAGIWIVGVHSPSGELRGAVMDYASEYQVGPLLEEFNTTTNDDGPAIAWSFDHRYRLYKIDRFTPNGDQERGLDRWSDWPGDLGAPFQDVDANGVWDPGIDLPEFTGQQMVWCVCNDANNGLHAALGATAPLGLELQCLYSAFRLRGPLDSAMVIRWTIINRSDADYRDVYLGLWSDPDLGDANDDLPGSDSTLSLGYVYNGDNLDGIGLTDTLPNGYGSRPPALGFQILQGPLIDGSSGDTARFGGRLIPGKRNLEATSFVVIINSNYPELAPLPDGNPERYARMAHDWLMGKAGGAGSYLMRPDGSPYPNFWFSGDPVAGTGDLPPYFPLGRFNPWDLQVLLNTGPFTLARGDTQEVVAAVLLARGADRLQSVTTLKAHAHFIRDMFENDYRFLNVPEQPSVIRDEPVPTEFLLRQNYPNPFNPGTTLEYELPEPVGVTLRVFDCFGREVRTLIQSRHPSGFFAVDWDGTDASGRKAASGVYFARLEALRDNGTMRISTLKMLLVR